MVVDVCRYAEMLVLQGYAVVAGGGGDRGQLVEFGGEGVGDRVTGAGHGAPPVPGQQLHLGESGGVPEQIAGHPPPPRLARTVEAAPGRIEVTAAATDPGVAGHDELVPRHR